MSFQFTLQKVMQVREREKIKVQAEYQDAIDHFEIVATQLYELLKTKESLEEQARNQITSGTSIYELQQHQNELFRLQQAIQHKQYATQVAREKMAAKEQDLVLKTIEVKKYEKMKQLKHEQYQQELKRRELIQMDELSVQLFVKR
ncbi:flagellar export protein FliJ [Alkalihalobacillus sp. MEB130]|uniref:flagellar export protein FliJ n=1 Tax=Alkalihalobacillus sp. MEB130 TaxID=2976704 RepID=UPI0028E07442|nr:flagellar export protein FliJ [Alkalihalobacillus sp. MEB130]MDT8859025.1 flagellar export protein FliJ [Alkalihalobacillus sp. MEB130]